MGSEFIKNLKDALDKGEFNSEIANKFKEIDKRADQLSGLEEEQLKERVEKRAKEKGVKTIEEEKIAELNSEYEEKMEKLKKIDEANLLLVTLIENEELLKVSLENMVHFIDELETKFEKEFEEENPLYGDLSQKIEEIKSKYKSIINN